MKNRFIISIIVMFTVLLFSMSCSKDEEGDGTVPEIVVLGINPLYWALDIPYEDAGAIAFDVTIEGDTVDITNKIVVTSNVDFNAVGDYSVIYNVTDASGVDAIEKVRSVKVVIGK